jgi:hypothetical protein
LHLNFDGDAKDSSGKENQAFIYGTTWADGYANIDIKVGLAGTLLKKVALVNSTDGTFTIPAITVPSIVGQYNFYLQVRTGNQIYNQTTIIIVDRLKIIEGGVTESSTIMGEAQTIWFKAVYEFNDFEFNDTFGTLFTNGYAMKWSEDNRRWELEYSSIVLGTVTFRVTGFTERKYGLTDMNDSVGPQSMVVYARVNPVSWINVLLLGMVAIFSLLGIFGFKIEKVFSDAKS